MAGSFQYLRNVTTLEYDARRCNGCTMCVAVCPHGVFTMRSKKAEVVERDACMECGACARNCPETAISVRAGVGCAYLILLRRLKGAEYASCCD